MFRCILNWKMWVKVLLVGSLIMRFCRMLIWGFVFICLISFVRVLVDM